MSNERSRVRADGVSDPEVSELYREIATERTPASLNEAVLRRATQTAGKGYARSIAWMRPMAWAATIGLCLAIVVELSDLTEPELDANVGRSGEEDIAAFSAEHRDVDARASRRDRSSAEELSVEKNSRRADAPADLRDAGAQPASAAAPGQNAPAISMTAAGNARPAVAADRASPGRGVATNQAANEAAAFHVTRAPILESAAAMERMRAGPDRAASQTTLSAVAAESGLPACDAQSTATPESWLECIKKLRGADRDAEADEQEAELAAAFPDFEVR